MPIEIRRIGLWLTCLFTITVTKCVAQNYELGFFAGTSYYLGDVNPNIHFENAYIPALGICLRKNLNKRYALRFGVYYGQLSGDDKNTGLPFNIFRNYSFHSTIYDFSGHLEFNFLPYETGNRSYMPFTPYVLIGPSIFYSDISSKGHYFDQTAYSASSTLMGFAINFGAGMKFSITKNIGLSIEWGMRKAYTDKLDGLSDVYSNDLQESNPNNKDWYNFSGIILSYKFIRKIDKCPRVNF